jgi:endonuclease/exonuclease/phosphatase family metal-dependent hydrolase
MSELKIATFNLEWMISIFGGLWKDWQSPTIPVSFPSKNFGGIKLEAIADVPALCERIAGVIRDINAQIIGIEEGPPLKEQLEVFVQRFLSDEYVIYHSNAKMQSICALVHRSISNHVTAFDPNSQETKLLRSEIPYYIWGDIDASTQKHHKFDRIPLVLSFHPEVDKELKIVIVHTKSKYSLLKTAEQWVTRDPAAIRDALDAREALSAEVMCLRGYLDKELEPPNGNTSLVVIGDFNDGPFAELIEREFLIHNIIDELAGSLLLPMHYFRHAMTPDILASAASTCFPDPLQNGLIVEELIDHILISPGIWQEKAAFNLKPGSCQVEINAYNNHNDDIGLVRERGLRPSDHKPVSAIFTYG